ncbi:flavonoid 3'-monooxygenase CYP75B137-like isoform X2 [Wolffia australiana]
MDLLPLSLTVVAAAVILLFLNRFISFSSSSSPRLPPGPWGWPVVGNLPQLGKKPHETLASFAQTYGPIFRLRLGSVPVIVAASPSTAALFLKTHDATFANRPPNTGSNYMAYDRQDLVWAPYGPLWRMLRRICSNHLFSPKALDDSSRLRHDEVAQLARSLAAAGGAEGVRVGDHLIVCTANILTRAMLGRRLFAPAEDLADGGRDAARQFREMSVELSYLAGVFMVGDFVPALRWLDSKDVIRRMKRLGERVLIGLKGRDSLGDGVQLTDINIKALLLDLFNAGTDTSSSTLEWLLAELVRHPELLTSVQRELDEAVGLERLVEERDLAKAPLLHAIVKETLRLHPPTPLLLPHQAAEDCTAGEYRVPAGATLLVNVWAIGRDPAVWTDPLEFRPARFLPGGEHAHVDVKGNSFEIIPFGAGRRICAGMSLAMRVILLVAATLVHGFDWGLPEGKSREKLSMEEAYGLTLQRAAPLKLCPIPRLPPHAYGSAS